MVLTGVDSFLKSTNEFLVDYNPDAEPCFSPNMEGELWIYGLVNHHATAFDQGFIPCQRLYEVVVPLFLKLSRKASPEPEPRNLPRANSKRFKDKLFVGLGAGLSDILDPFVRVEVGHEMVQPHTLGPKKRAEFVRALMRNTFPEVRSIF